MKHLLKKSILITLALAMLFTFASCGLSADQLKKKLDNWEKSYDNNNDVYYDLIEKSELDWMMEDFEEEFDLDLDDSVVRGYLAWDEREELDGETCAYFLEFESSGDAKAAQKCFESKSFQNEDNIYLSDMIMKNYTVIRKGKIVMFGDKNIIESVLD